MGELGLIIYYVVLVIFLVFLNGFFVAAEFALVKVRSDRIQAKAEEGSRRAKMSMHLIQNLDAYLSACQVGITIASLALGWIGEKGVATYIVEPILKKFNMPLNMVHPVAFGIAFSIITFLHIVVGEMAPKSMALRKPEITSLWIAWPLRAFYWIMYPVIWVLNESALTILRWVGLSEAHEHDQILNADELRSLLERSSKHAHLTKISGSLLINALDLRKRKARQVMVHRTRISYLSTKKSLYENLAITRQSGYSRFPLCDGTIDNIVGMVHLKDLLWLIQEKGEKANIASVKRDILFVPEILPLEKLLNTFLTKRVHMAILFDEYGTIVGLVTLENVLEEILGDIQDETDQEALMFQKISENEYRLHGELPIHDLEEPFDIHLDSEDVTTIGGYLVQELGHFPRKGESLRLNDYLFTVLRTAGHQIIQIGVTKLETEEESVGQPD
jgi:CBS domain containing-hemolysin-like protein